ncbi:hypothetical protein M407DRAFT_6850 [Tulasnella calospora MUT 4182]|uniref:Uncharacterized protein n=1 Tax=Tulasnella calospora MUT 4182 TaxID=1051891 RepID=A0A0C3L3K0_9AGAM|nr:hypothetical protein M407DRAFT_6850 [Tulasnella calospora MUT 4182]
MSVRPASPLETENKNPLETTSDNYRSLVLWARRIRERIIAIENARPPIARLTPDLLRKILLHDIDFYFAFGGQGENIWMRRENLRRVMRRWRDAIDSSPEWWRWSSLTLSRNDVLRCFRNNPREPIHVNIVLSGGTQGLEIREKAMVKAVEALAEAVDRVQSLKVLPLAGRIAPEVQRFLSLPMPTLFHLRVIAGTPQNIAIHLGEGVPLRYLELSGSVAVPWGSPRLSGLHTFSIGYPDGLAGHSGDILRITGSTNLKSMRLTRVILEGLDAAPTSNVKSPIVISPYSRRFYFDRTFHPKPPALNTRPSTIISLEGVRLPLTEPKVDGSLIWQLLKAASLARHSCIAIQIDKSSSESYENQATITQEIMVGNVRCIHLHFEVTECSSLVQFFDVGFREWLNLPVIGIWCTSPLLDFTPILHWLVAPHTLDPDGGRLCPLLGNLGFHRCDNLSEDLLNGLERRILYFDEEKCGELLEGSKFRLWVDLDEISTSPIYHRAVLRDHCQSWDNLKPVGPPYGPNVPRPVAPGVNGPPGAPRANLPPAVTRVNGPPGAPGVNGLPRGPGV